MKRWTPLLTVLFALALVLLLAAAADACPMCKDSIATAKNDLGGKGGPPGGGSVGGGFNHSIYLMLGGFLSAMGLVAFNLFRGMKK